MYRPNRDERRASPFVSGEDPVYPDGYRAVRVLLGSGYPFDMGPIGGPVAEVQANPLLTDAEKRQICSGTAATLFNLARSSQVDHA